MADGAELLIIGSVTRAVSEEWKLNAWQRGSIVSMVFIGVCLGNLLGGKVGDSIGRRLPIVTSYGLIFVFSILSILASGYWSMVSIRFFVGVAFGLGQPAWNAISGEIVPANRRLHMTTLSCAFFAVGEFYSASLIYIDSPHMVNLHWRWLIVMGAIPSLLFCICSYFWLVESPSFLATHGRVEEAMQVLEHIRDANGYSKCRVNFKPSPLLPENDGSMAKLGVVFGRNLLFTSVVTCTSCLVVNFVFFGGLYSFPQVLPDMELKVTPALNLMISALWELPGYVLAFVVCTYFTRKNSMLGYLLAVGFSTLLFAYAAAHLVTLKRGSEIPLWLEASVQLGILGNKMFASVGFVTCFLYSIEIYPTFARTTGTSVCVAFGRVGAIVSPLVYELMGDVTGGPFSFFYIMAGLCFMNAVLVSQLTKETKDAPLKDDHDEEHEPLMAKRDA